MGRVREKRRVEERRAEERRSEKKKSQNFFAGAGKGRKVANHCVFPTICGSGGWKSRLAKAKHIVENTSRSDHFWKLRCRKRAHRYAAKQISRSKV